MQETFLPKEWPYLEGPPAFKSRWDPVIHILKGHSDSTRCCSYSYDGKLLASGSDDGTMRLWDTSSGKVQHTFRCFNDNHVLSIALSSTGFITASNGTTIKMWNLSTGEQLKLSNEYLHGERGVVGDIKFSNDGNILAAAVGRDILFWHIPGCRLILRQYNAFSDMNDRFIEFSKHDALLGSLSNQDITIWSLENNVADNVMNGGFHGSKSEVQDCQRLKRERVLIIPTSHKVQACGIAFSPNSRYVATGTKTKVYIWDWKAGNPPVELTGHVVGINTVVFSKDGLFLASASYDATIRVWREPWAAKQPPLILSRHLKGVYGLSFSPLDTCLATCSSDETVQISDYGSYKPQVQSEIGSSQGQDTPHTLAISRVALSENGKWVASASGDGLICLWDGKSGKLHRILRGHELYVQSLEFSHDSRKLISASNDDTVRIWSLEDDFQSRTLSGHQGCVRCAVLSCDGTLLASGSGSTVHIWDLMQHEVGHTIPNQEEEEGRKGEMGESNGAQGVRILRRHVTFVDCVSFSQDGRYVVSGACDGEIILWDLRTGHKACSPIQSKNIKERGREGIDAMTFSADSKKFIASASESIFIWDITGEDGSLRFDNTVKLRSSSTFCSLSVDINYPQYFITERGPILMEGLRDGAEALLVSEPWCPYSVSLDTETSITWNDKKLILLPEGYPPALYTDAIRVQGHKVVVGCLTGEVLIFRFKEDADWLDVL